MQKCIITVFTVTMLLLCTAPSAFSQPVFGQNYQTQSNITTSSGRPQPNPIMSSSDFGGMVSTMDNQTKSKLAEQYTQQLNQQKQANAMANAAAKKQEDNTPNAATSIMNTPENEASNLQQNPAGNVLKQNAPQGNPNQGGVNAPTMNLPQTSPGMPPAQQQPQVYTGFGAGTQNNAPMGSAPRPNTQRPNTAPNQQPSGGWNIQY